MKKQVVMLEPCKAVFQTSTDLISTKINKQYYINEKRVNSSLDSKAKI